MKHVEISLEALKGFTKENHKKFSDNTCVVSEYIKKLGYTNPHFSTIDGNFTAFNGNEMCLFDISDSFVKAVYQKPNLLQRAVEFFRESQAELAS